MERYKIIKIESAEERKVSGPVADEVPLTVFINNEELVTLLSSPGDLKELAVGFLYTSGFIKSFAEISRVVIDKQRWSLHLELKGERKDLHLVYKRLFTSGCGRGTLFYKAADLIHKNKQRLDTAVDRRQVFRMMGDFQTRSSGYKETGGLHSAALADKEGIIVVREDIGRHNAVDKILGNALINKIDLKDKIILSSGRVSSEILLKVQKTEIPILISRSAPTDQAIKHAISSGITLIGFARGSKMNIYSGRERIL